MARYSHWIFISIQLGKSRFFGSTCKNNLWNQRTILRQLRLAYGLSFWVSNYSTIGVLGCQDLLYSKRRSWKERTSQGTCLKSNDSYYLVNLSWTINVSVSFVSSLRVYLCLSSSFSHKLSSLPCHLSDSFNSFNSFNIYSKQHTQQNFHSV